MCVCVCVCVLCVCACVRVVCVCVYVCIGPCIYTVDIVARYVTLYKLSSVWNVSDIHSSY